MTGQDAFDPKRIVETLNRHHVDYVLVGGYAAQLLGVDLAGKDHFRHLRISESPLRTGVSSPGREILQTGQLLLLGALVDDSPV